MGQGDEFESLLDEAAADAGLDDFGDDWFHGPLRAWADDLEQPGLTDFGRRFLRTQAVRDLVRRLRVLDALRAHPEIDEVVVPPIVYVTGLERSGTTLLHNLLGLHRDARTLRRWELMEPLPPPEAETHGTDPRIAKVQAQVDRLRGSTLEHMHWVDADDPEECVWGFIDSVSMLGQAASLCMPAWARFLREEDLTPAFVHYRRVVQLLLWKHPVGLGGFLVLKAPQIGGHLPSFAAAFPEAHFVITDRDPFRTVVSMAVMGASIIEPFCEENPLADDGQRGRLCGSSAAAKLATMAAFTTAAPAAVTHVPYPTLVTDPVGAVQRIHVDRWASDPGLGDAIERFLVAQRAGRRAAPPTELDPMGYDRSELWSDPSVAAYCERFGIEPERTRLTGATPPT